jgi:chemotaxis protein CheD
MPPDDQRDPSDTGTPEIYVQPGESHLVRSPVILRTLLGSCVGMTFWNEKLMVAALCHPMLPEHPKAKLGKLGLAAARRFVEFAIRDLAAQFDALGARRTETEVKLFGGADVLDVERNPTAKPTVGKLNANKALAVLDELGFEVIASRLGGNEGCHIDFHTGTGEVRLRRLNR